MSIGAAYAFGRDCSILAALELDGWMRNIRGAGGSAGLQGTYLSLRQPPRSDYSTVADFAELLGFSTSVLPP
jgi:hypothetical protein